MSATVVVKFDMFVGYKTPRTPDGPWLGKRKRRQAVSATAPAVMKREDKVDGSD